MGIAIARGDASARIVDRPAIPRHGRLLQPAGPEGHPDILREPGLEDALRGDQNISFYVRVYNAPYDDLDDDNPIRHCNASFETVVRNMDGGVIDSPILQWDAQQVDNDISISDGSTSSFSGFQFDLRPECDIGTYNLTFCLRYENTRGPPRSSTPT